MYRFKKGGQMVTNVELDDNLIDETHRLGKHATREEAVRAALQEYITRHRQLQILDLFGTIDFDSPVDDSSAHSGGAKMPIQESRSTKASSA
jgi:metal-responsive CopG/Arc/MetJ family transcriptional regulator